MRNNETALPLEQAGGRGTPCCYEIQIKIYLSSGPFGLVTMIMTRRTAAAANQRKTLPILFPLEFLSCKESVGFLVLIYRLVDHFLRKIVIAVRISL